MCSNGAINQYLLAGKVLTPLNGKIPKLKDWTSRKLTDDKILSHNGNLGMVIDEGDLVVDVDPKNGGTASFEKLAAYLASEGAEALTPTVMTPSGGFHVYLKIPTHYIGKSFKKTLKKEYPGIDFLTQGTQCVIATSSTKAGLYEWHDDILGGFEQIEAPTALVDLIAQGNTKTDQPDASDLGDFEGLIGSGGWSEDKVLAMLDKLDPSMPNDEWVKVGMALHDWNPVTGLALWEYWSKGGDNYKDDETEKRWRSFDSGGGVTLGTISYMVKEVVFDDLSDQLASYISLIDAADEKELKLSVVPKIKKLELDSDSRNRLAVTIQRRLHALTSIKPLIGICREMIAGANSLAQALSNVPDWCHEWVYVNSHRGYVDFKKLQVHKSEAFNLINTKQTPYGPNGPILASQYATLFGAVKTVDSMAYLPMKDEKLCTVDGHSVLNTFNPRTIPDTAEGYTKGGKDAIKRIKKHINFICTTDENAELLTMWLAHQVQYPGRQMLWSPLIQSIPGTGKSFFGEMLCATLGDPNVGKVAPAQVTSDFNGWATNVVVNVLEELQVKGHNRYEVVNALKPLITDRMIQINEKGVKPYKTVNTANYICFTNSKDALPLDDTDRRWWVMFVPIQKLTDLKSFVGEELEDYFPALFEAVRSHGPEIRKWMLEYDITDEFKNIKQAPMTEYKMMMAATEEASIEGLGEVREMLETGSEFFNTECISTSHLFADMLFEHPDIDLKTSKQAYILKRLGFQKVPSKIKISGRSLRIWTKYPMTNEEIRKQF